MKHTNSKKANVFRILSPLTGKKGETGTMCPPVKKWESSEQNTWENNTRVVFTQKKKKQTRNCNTIKKKHE